jgi:hypothetical protein
MQPAPATAPRDPFRRAKRCLFFVQMATKMPEIRAISTSAPKAANAALVIRASTR